VENYGKNAWSLCLFVVRSKLQKLIFAAQWYCKSTNFYPRSLTLTSLFFFRKNATCNDKSIEYWVFSGGENYQEDDLVRGGLAIRFSVVFRSVRASNTIIVRLSLEERTQTSGLPPVLQHYRQKQL
jgi:hypothetical protein